MTYEIFALQNTPARLCVSKTRTDSPMVRDLAKEYYEAKGLIVTETCEA